MEYLKLCLNKCLPPQKKLYIFGGVFFLEEGETPYKLSSSNLLLVNSKDVVNAVAPGDRMVAVLQTPVLQNLHVIIMITICLFPSHLQRSYLIFMLKQPISHRTLFKDVELSGKSQDFY